MIKSSVRESTGTHVIEASTAGKHSYCFGNQMSSITAKSVSFNVHDMQKIENTAKGNVLKTSNMFMPNRPCLEDIDPIEREIRELADSIFAIKAEQEYIVIRERQHRDSKFGQARTRNERKLTMRV